MDSKKNTKVDISVDHINKVKKLLTEAQEVLTLYLETEKGSMQAGWVNQAKMKLELTQQTLNLL